MLRVYTYPYLRYLPFSGCYPVFPSSPVRFIHRALNTRAYIPLYSYMHCVDVSHCASLGHPFLTSYPELCRPSTILEACVIDRGV